MVFVIKSAVINFDRRTAIRKTWGSVKIFGDASFEIVFVLGKPSNKNFTQNILTEDRKHGDILQFDLEDSAAYVSIG